MSREMAVEIFWVVESFAAVAGIGSSGYVSMNSELVLSKYRIRFVQVGDLRRTYL